jgi:hypothetical protein
MRGGVLAVAETPEQAALAARRYPGATIVALTAAVDAWREREGRTDPTVEDLLDERLLGELGAGMIDVVEALSTRVVELSGPLLGIFDPHRDLTLRAFFHYLKTHFDGVVIRVEQACAVVDALRPEKVLVFDTVPWRMTGLTCLDKPVLGLMQHVLKRLAETRGLDVEVVSTAGSVLSAPMRAHATGEETPAAERGASAGRSAPPRGGIAVRLIGRLRRELTKMSRRQGEIGRRRASAAMSEQSLAAHPSIAPSAAAVAAAERPWLVLALFVDLGPAIGELWKADGGRIIAPQSIPAGDGAVDEISDVQARCRELWSVMRNDREIGRLLNHRGVDLRKEMFQLLEPIVCERFPVLWADTRRYDSWFATHHAVVLFGGLVDTHYILARVAARHGVPVVSYHIGGFHGFSLIPIHERYDRAECDYFVCGGPVARDTFAAPPAEARWRDDVRRARSVPLGAPWIADLVRHARRGSPAPRPIKRVMVVLNALLGDCRYLGRVFPPEIAYWRFTRRLVERLAKEPLEIIVKPPLLNRYPQQRNPVEDWLEERRYPNVSILREVPLADCLDQADAFLLESPSTPLPHIAATRSALLLYMDRDVYRLVPAARDLLARRCAVLGESEEEFFEGLEWWTAEIRAGRALAGGFVDDGFLENVCTGSGPPSSAERMVSFLKDVQAAHPLDDQEIMTAARWTVIGKSAPAIQTA